LHPLAFAQARSAGDGLAILRKDATSMISRVVVALAAVTAAVGLLLFGMGYSYNPRNDGLETAGLIMLFGGLIALGAGIVWYRKTEQVEEAAIEAEIRRRAS
jgi:hypothetical protein